MFFGKEFDDVIQYEKTGSLVNHKSGTVYELVENTTGNINRWSYDEIIVIRDADSGTCWRAIFELPATEMQEDSFDDEEPKEWTRVIQGRPVSWHWITV